jgi:WhiB family redox-sensing transcriptional regulator
VLPIKGLEQDLSWQVHANCIGCDPDAFFPQRGASAVEARRVCAGCEVREECLEYALTTPIKFGIWGGRSERERKKMREARNRIARTVGAA